MKRFKNMSMKAKRKLAVAGAALAIIAVGGTIAYNHNTAIFNNHFRLAADEIEAQDITTEALTAQPCDEYDKAATVTNKNDTPRYVRMKINEYWRVENSTQTDHETSDLALTWTEGDNTYKYATWNADAQNEDKWILKNDGYYYYYQPLAGGATTESLIDSVSFACNANLAGEMVYSDGGAVAETTVSPYANSVFHVYVIFEISDESFYPEPHAVDCDSDLLYDIIACQSQGSDENLDFNTYASSNSPNRDGVNTLAAHKEDVFPVHYFRGVVSNNYLAYNGYCWRLVRTAENGATKMAYAGELGAGGCTDNVTSVSSGYYQPDYSGGSTSGRYELAHGGYMFDGEEKYYDVSGNFAGHFAGKDVSWDGSKYTLIDYDRFGNPFNTGGRNYVCYDPSNPSDFGMECTFVVYATGYHGSTYSGIRLVGGAKWEDALTEMQTNTKNSAAKTAIDNWYSTNITEQSDLLATDVTYCNDRSIELSNQYSDVFLANGALLRIRGENGSTKPSVDCRKNDAFSVDSSTGNGALTYPVAMLTADEYIMAGFCFPQYPLATFPRGDSLCSGRSGNSYLDNNNTTWTMTPLDHVDNNTDIATVSDWSSIGYDTSGGANGIGYRPALALKFGVRVEGTGTQSDPYRIK